MIHILGYGVCLYALKKILTTSGPQGLQGPPGPQGPQGLQVFKNLEEIVMNFVKRY